MDEGSLSSNSSSAPAPFEQLRPGAHRVRTATGSWTGYGTIDGRPVCVFAQDFTVFGGSLGDVFSEKIERSWTCRGHRRPGDRDQRIRAVPASRKVWSRRAVRGDLPAQCPRQRVIPQISLISGSPALAARCLPAVTDFTVMVDQTAHVHHRPDVIKTAPVRTSEFEDWRGARTHNSKSGVAH